jgi:hypothetical protein
MRRIRLATLLLLPCLAPVGGCSEAATFDDTLMEMTDELEEVGSTFGEQVVRHEGNQALLEEDYADAVGAVGKIVKRAKSVRVPKANGAQAYYDAFLAYLEFEEGMTDDGFRKLVSAASRGDHKSLLTTMERLNAREEKEVEKVREAQREFARANDLPLCD